MSDETEMNLRDICAPVWPKNPVDLETRVQRLEDRLEDLIDFLHDRARLIGTFEGYLTDLEHEKIEKLK